MSVNHARPSRTEGLIAWGVIVVLAVVLAGVLWSSFVPNPAVKVAQVAARQAAQKAGGPSSLASFKPPELRVLSPAESFGPHNLHLKIDGKAELYLQSGFKKLICQRFALRADPKVWFEVFVYDMGQNFAGWAKLKVNAERGVTIQLRFAETVFDDGMIDPASTGVGATHVIQTDRYTCKGNGREEWEPRFTYHGFRYVEMSSFPGEPSLDNLEGIAVYTAVGNAGAFRCSDAMLNRIQQTALRTQTSNMHSLPEDCPAREKCGWLGDAHVTAE
ncbi:MAG: family 78 glycoside hydrolase catalytic domain, partial [Proteobacteria bacterium]|nr:family 78 glycoside hydrolase catalytic domain [Pseudomonadota bacterium]